MNRVLRIGSRGSELALIQTAWVRDRLQQAHRDLDVSIEVIKTLGDGVSDTPLSKMGGKGIFTREIEQALLDGRINIAVHSLKDLPTGLPEGLQIGAVSNREDVRDLFIPHPSNSEKTLVRQPRGAKIATGSLRRRCQLLRKRPDLEIVDLRGNLNTRFRKLAESSWNGMVLAMAGVKRMELLDQSWEALDLSWMLPAVGQGALAIEMREGDEWIARLLTAVHDSQTAAETTAERALLRKLEGGCQVPLGAFGRIEIKDGASRLLLDGVVGSLDGKRTIRDSVSGNPAEAERLGIDLAQKLLIQGAASILEEIRGSVAAQQDGV